MNTKHTPGPWIIQDDDEREHAAMVVGSPPATRIIAGDFPRSNEQAMADARLISAAPELLDVARDLEGYLEAIEIMANQIGETNAIRDKLRFIRRVIQKATQP